MNDLQLISNQQPGSISINNLKEVKAAVNAILSRYHGIIYTEDMLPDAKEDRKELKRLRKEIDERRKEIKKAYLVPYNNFEVQIKELIAMIDVPLEEINEFIDGINKREEREKRDKIKDYFMKHCSNLGSMAEQVFNSPAFFDPKWLNKTTPAKTWQSAVDEKISLAARDLQSIQATSGQYADAMTVRYLESLSMEGLAEYRSNLSAAAQAEAAQIETDIQDRRSGSKVIRISGAPEMLMQAMEILSLLGLDCDVLEDDTPQPMPELTAPEFDSFVAFDLETSGTYGAANGDTPAEITEIGAIRVDSGKITGRFSMLVNPGRKIVPRISRITGITDEMVASEPDVDTAIRRFAEFIGDSVLVGHNIKASDLYYIDRAARRAGVRIENPFFDTYCFARTIKESQGWTNVKLEYLSKVFGIEQSDAHRAWCDAEANVGVYFKLKEMEAEK